MAISINWNGASIRKPGAYSKSSVALTGGFPIAPTGVIGIIGEAEAGTPGNAEDIRENVYSSEQFADVVSKYKSGSIVDAFKLLIAPSNDSRVVNGAQQIYIYKTNVSTKATGTLPTAYGSLASKNYGFDQNTIYFQITSSQSESVPAFSSFVWLSHPTLAVSAGARINGGAHQALAIPATTLPSAVPALIAALSGLAATGGTNRAIIDAGRVADASQIAIAVTDGLRVTITISGTSPTWAVNPTVGDSLYIPSGSAIQGAGNGNIGAYLITGVTNNTINASKMTDIATVCENVLATDILAITDVMAFAPISISYDATTPDGLGAAVEIYDKGGGIILEELISGGNDRGILGTTQVIDGSTLGLSVSGVVGTFTISSAFAALASVNDIITIRPGSILQGVGRVNVGNWRITSASSNVIMAIKLLDTTPVTVAAADIIATTDLLAYAGIASEASYPLASYSSAEKKIMISLDRQSDGESEDSAALGGNIGLKIGYKGTTASLTINSVNLTTTIAGGSGSNLTIKLSDYDTIQQLVDYINAQTDYTAEVGSNVYATLAPSVLDRVVAAGICEENAGCMPGRIKMDSQEVQDFFDDSTLIALTRTIFYGLPTTMTSVQFLSGGLKGGTTNASVQAGFDDMQKVRINSILPLFSRNATDDIIDGLTEPSSTYQISSINAMAKSHVILMSTTKKRSERNAYCSYKGTYTASKTEANSLASSRVALAIQDVKVLKASGDIEWIQPWGLAAIAAGMQAGAPVGEPMTFKYINVAGIRHSSFDPATQYDDAIDNGILFAEQPEQGGYRIVVGNTTYGADENFVYNRISVLYAADIVAYNLRKQLEAIYVGVNSAIADAQSIKNTCVNILNSFLEAGIIKGDDSNNGKGYKELTVTMSGSIATIRVTITPAQGVDFELIDITLDTIREAA